MDSVHYSGYDELEREKELKYNDQNKKILDFRLSSGDSDFGFMSYTSG